MRALVLFLALLVVGAPARAGAPPPGGGAGEDVPYEFAPYTVNGRPITRSHLLLRAAPQIKRLNRIKDQRKKMGLWGLRDAVLYAQALERARLNAVRGVVFGEILRTEAQRFVKMGFKVSERDVEKRWREMLKQAGGPRKLAVDRGLSLEALKEMARDDLLAEAYQRNLRVTAARPTPQEVADYYKFNSGRFRKPESVRAQVVFIKRLVYDEKLGRSVERKTARKRAEMVLAKLKAGADFAELARRYSEDPASAAQDGLLGSRKKRHLVGRGQFRAGLDRALFAGRPGELSGVVEGPDNYCIVKVIKHLAAGVPPLAEIEEEVFARCYFERIGKIEEKLFRESYKKILLIDAEGRPVPLEKIWPKRPAPRGTPIQT